jgi:hypothetical protein
MVFLVPHVPSKRPVVNHIRIDQITNRVSAIRSAGWLAAGWSQSYTVITKLLEPPWLLLLPPPPSAGFHMFVTRGVITFSLITLALSRRRNHFVCGLSKPLRRFLVLARSVATDGGFVETDLRATPMHVIWWIRQWIFRRMNVWWFVSWSRGERTSNLPSLSCGLGVEDNK